ncbi:MAG: hypothetical protein ACP5FZ_06610 [Fidelibacterota bacterium]
MSISVIIYLILSTLNAQTVFRYYRSYADFIRQLDVSPVEVVGQAFYRATIEGQRIKQLDFIMTDGRLAAVTRYYYDHSGNLVVRDSLTADSVLVSRIAYQPDKIQAQLLEKMYGRDWLPTQKDYYTVCWFDSLQNPVKYQVKSASGEDVGRLELRYNDRNDLTMEIWIRSHDDKVIELTDFEFNYANSVQHIVQYDSSGIIVSEISLQLPESPSDSTLQELR